MTTDPKKIAGWIGLPIIVVALITTLWQAVQYAVREQIEDMELDAIPAAVASLQVTARRLDSMTTSNDRWKRKQICRQRGYELGDCPLLFRELGEEPLAPNATEAELPEVQ